MMEFKNITEGFINFMRSELGTADPTKEKLAAERLAICYECPIRTENKCDKSKGGCGCYLKLKVRSKSKCPKNKW